MRQFLHRVLEELSRTYRGSNHISYVVRKYIEGLDIRQVVGVNLAALSFFAAVAIPQADGLASTLAMLGKTRETVIEVVPTQAKFQWPMRRFGLSQGFYVGHPGLDLTDPLDTPVYPVANGWVEWNNYSAWGYGNYLLIEHGGGIQSLYAHLSGVDVKAGDTVTQQTKIGAVGNTGWATGYHLHLEIYQDNTPINPLEVLPEIK